MELVLAISTILGGIAAIWYFWDKSRTVDWSRIRLSRAKLANSQRAELELSGQSEGFAGLDNSSKTFEPTFPSIVGGSVAEHFPEYRLPVLTDIRGDWALFGDPHTLFPFFCRGDFFGNGKEDYAVFILNDKTQCWQVVVVPHQNTNRKTPVVLASGDGMAQNMYIQTLRPGRYRTINDKGYSISDPEGRKVLRLRRDGINLGTFESADAVYYWDKSKRQFIEVWMSD